MCLFQQTFQEINAGSIIPGISPSFAPEDTYPPAVHVCCKQVSPYQIFANTIFDTHLGVFGIKWYCIFSQNNFKMNQEYFSNILKFRLKSPYVLDLNSLTPVLDPTGLYVQNHYDRSVDPPIYLWKQLKKAAKSEVGS